MKSIIFVFFLIAISFCTRDCPFGYFANVETGDCKECVHPCATCETSPVDCTSCASGTHRNDR